MKKKTESFSQRMLYGFFGLILFNSFFGEEEKNEKEPKVRKAEKV